MRRRGFSPGPSGVLSVTPNAACEAPAKPHLLGHALFWIALHMMASSCLVKRSASLPSMCPASPTADDSQQTSRFQRRGSQDPDPPCVHRHVPSNSFQRCIRHARPPQSDTAHRAAVAAGLPPRVCRPTPSAAQRLLQVALLFITMLGSRCNFPPFCLHPLPWHDTRPSASSLALSMKSVSVSFLVVFRNLIAVFVAAFEFFVQVNAPAFATLHPLLDASRLSHACTRRDKESAWGDWVAFLQCCRWLSVALALPNSPSRSCTF